MRKLKSIIKSKARFHTDIDIYAVDEHVSLPIGLKFIKDRPGHASLVVAQDMPTEELIKKLEKVANILESIGTVRVK